MDNMSPSLHSKIHKWMDAIGFRLNGSQTNRQNNVTTNHYFFETFNFLEKAKNNDLNNSKFLCFDRLRPNNKSQVTFGSANSFF